jgi:hypothetical protein
MAQKVKIPLERGLYTNADPVETQDFATVLNECFVTKSGGMVKRPGLSLAVSLGTDKPVEGLYWFNEGGYALAVSDGMVFKLTKSGSDYSAAELTGSTLRDAAATGGAARCVFTDDGTNVYIANGGAINYHVSGSGTCQPLADGDAPTTVSHVAFLDQYILALKDGTNQFYWSDLGDGLSWTATSYASAEGDADWILHLGVGYREICLFGEQSIEIWYNDGATPFSRIPGAYIQRGISSQDSVQFINGAWVFLDDNNNVCRMIDRSIVEVSAPIEKELKELGNISDALSSRIDIAGETFYVLSFPTADRTFVWQFSMDEKYDGWSEWCGAAGAARFRGQVHTHSFGWSVDLVGDKGDTGKVLILSTSNVDDEATAAIVATRRTGWIDHGILNYKHCNGLTIKAKDSANDTVTAPVLKVRYRDDGSTSWSSYVQIPLTGDGVQRVTQLGRYRSRQWEFLQDEQCLLDLATVEEEVEVMLA